MQGAGSATVRVVEDGTCCTRGQRRWETGWMLERSDVSGAACERVPWVEHSPKVVSLGTQKNGVAVDRNRNLKGKQISE